MKWINRVGIILEFISFWFAAPEVFGIGRLKVWDNKIQSKLKDETFTRGLAKASLRIMAYIGMFWLIFVSIWGFLILKNYNFLKPNLKASFLFFFANLFLYFIVIVIVKFISIIIEPVGQQFVISIFSPLLKILEQDETISRKWILTGAGLYVIGFLLQIVSTF